VSWHPRARWHDVERPGCHSKSGSSIRAFADLHAQMEAYLPMSLRVLSAIERDLVPRSSALAVRRILGVLVIRSVCAAMRNQSRRARVPTQVPELRDFVQLQRLELSYNELRSLAPLSALASPALEELFAASNKLPCIEARPRMEWRSICRASCNHNAIIRFVLTLSPTAVHVMGVKRHCAPCVCGYTTCTAAKLLPSCCFGGACWSC
jgi:hypothetical protein